MDSKEIYCSVGVVLVDDEKHATQLTWEKMGGASRGAGQGSGRIKLQCSHSEWIGLAQKHTSNLGFQGSTGMSWWGMNDLY